MWLKVESRIIFPLDGADTAGSKIEAQCLCIKRQEEMYGNPETRLSWTEMPPADS